MGSAASARGLVERDGLGPSLVRSVGVGVERSLIGGSASVSARAAPLCVEVKGVGRIDASRDGEEPTRPAFRRRLFGEARMHSTQTSQPLIWLARKLRVRASCQARASSLLQRARAAPSSRRSRSSPGCSFVLAWSVSFSFLRILTQPRPGDFLVTSVGPRSSWKSTEPSEGV